VALHSLGQVRCRAALDAEVYERGHERGGAAAHQLAGGHAGQHRGDALAADAAGYERVAHAVD
jgi:hypothetical protein